MIDLLLTFVGGMVFGWVVLGLALYWKFKPYIKMLRAMG